MKTKDLGFPSVALQDYIAGLMGSQEFCCELTGLRWNWKKLMAILRCSLPWITSTAAGATSPAISRWFAASQTSGKALRVFDDAKGAVQFLWSALT